MVKAPTGLSLPRTGNLELDRFLNSLLQRMNQLPTEIVNEAMRVTQANTDSGSGSGTTPQTPITQIPRLDTPPQPTGLDVSCGVDICFLEWNNPLEYYSNHARTKIYRNTVDDFDTSTEVGQAECCLLYTSPSPRDS